MGLRNFCDIDYEAALNADAVSVLLDQTLKRALALALAASTTTTAFSTSEISVLATLAPPDNGIDSAVFSVGRELSWRFCIFFARTRYAKRS
jgi:hypothetical protein